HRLDRLRPAVDARHSRTQTDVVAAAGLGKLLDDGPIASRRIIERPVEMSRVRPPTEKRLDDERGQPQALQSLSADGRRQLTARRAPELLRIIQEKARGNFAAIRAEGEILETAGRVSSSEAASQQVES